MHFTQFALVALFGQTLALTPNTDAPTNSTLDRRHIEMIFPDQRNFDNQEWGHLNPLASDGSNYPCRPRKGLKLKVKGSPTHFTIGKPFKVKFAGEKDKEAAVHGGGSCQFSLSKGHSPTKDTRFYVIKSIEGGCPKRHAEGNLKLGESPDEYDVEIPPQFEPGDWVFAWTWINRIGLNPEYYMNCSPIRIVAGAEKSMLRRRRVHHGSPKEEVATPEVTQPGVEGKEPGTKEKDTAPKEKEPIVEGKEPSTKEKDTKPNEKKEPGVDGKEPGTKGSPPGTKEKETTPKDKEARPSGKDLGGIDQYPAVFMANLGSVGGGCSTRDALTARRAILYPHPGKIVERANGDADANLFKQPCDGNPHNKNR